MGDLKISSILIHDTKRFVPHLTLARIKYIKDLQKLTWQIQQFSKNLYQELVVDEIVYYESILNHRGPACHPLNRFPLRGDR